MTPGRLGALGDLLFAINEEKKAGGDILVLPATRAYWESFSMKDFLTLPRCTGQFVTVVY